MSYPTLLRVPYPSIMKMVIHCVMRLGLERSMFQLVEGKDRFVPYILVYIIYSERHQESGHGAPKGIRWDDIQKVSDGCCDLMVFPAFCNRHVLQASMGLEFKASGSLLNSTKLNHFQSFLVALGTHPLKYCKQITAVPTTLHFWDPPIS